MKKCIRGIYFAFLFWNLGLVLFASGKMKYACRKSFDFSNWIYLMLGVLLFAVAALLYRALERRIADASFFHSDFFHSDRPIVLMSVLLFIAQIYVIYNYYFRTGWDAGNIVIPCAEQVAVGGDGSAWNSYFSCYPNNLLLVWIFSVVRKIDLRFGILDVNTGLMGLITFQCLLCSLAGYFLYKTAEMILGRRTYAWASWVLFVGLAGISPWISIPYSDAVGLFFPITIFYLYMRKRHWGLIAFLSVWGYQIKPQLVIVTIASVIITLLQLWQERPHRFSLERPMLWRTVRKAAPVALGCVLAVLSSRAAVSSVGVTVDADKTFGVEHFVMMGLNGKKNGIWLEEDVKYSQSFDTRSERSRGNLEKIRKRLKKFGPVGLVWHLARKSLTNFADGTFGWTNEGSFFRETYEDKNHFFSPRIKAVYYKDGIYSHLWNGAAQMLWIFILAGGIGLLLPTGGEQNGLLVCMLALIGLTVFELLFEARARYLFTYVPLFILAGVSGWRKICAMQPLTNRRFTGSDNL